MREKVDRDYTTVIDVAHACGRGSLGIPHDRVASNVFLEPRVIGNQFLFWGRWILRPLPRLVHLHGIVLAEATAGHVDLHWVLVCCDERRHERAHQREEGEAHGP